MCNLVQNNHAYGLMENLAIMVIASYGGSKATKVLIPKIHINGKINTKMEKNIKNQCWVGLMRWLIN